MSFWAKSSLNSFETSPCQISKLRLSGLTDDYGDY